MRKPASVRSASRRYSITLGDAAHNGVLVENPDAVFQPANGGGFVTQPLGPFRSTAFARFVKTPVGSVDSLSRQGRPPGRRACASRPSAARPSVNWPGAKLAQATSKKVSPARILSSQKVRPRDGNRRESGPRLEVAENMVRSRKRNRPPLPGLWVPII